ncbi:MAG: leucine-rich repeat domain-containing protein [Holosporales bacterium]|nr:leucine-rich repeat domain-containing protein [Holosporales bacterium]
MVHRNEDLSGCKDILVGKDVPTLAELVHGADMGTNYTTRSIYFQNGSRCIIGEKACAHLVKLEEIVIPASVTAIGNCAFMQCFSLKNISLPNVTVIPICAFYSCCSLQSITLPAGLLSIGEMAFCGCTALTRLVIPASVTNIHPGAFFNTGLRVVDCSQCRELPFDPNRRSPFLNALFSQQQPNSQRRAITRSSDGCVVQFPDSNWQLTDVAHGSWTRN